MSFFYTDEWKQINLYGCLRMVDKHNETPGLGYSDPNSRDCRIYTACWKNLINEPSS